MLVVLYAGAVQVRLTAQQIEPPPAAAHISAAQTPVVETSTVQRVEAGSALQQEGEIRGSVSGVNGAPLGGARVTLSESSGTQDSGTRSSGTQVREVYTNADGSFAFAELTPGSFTLEATLVDFTSTRVSITVPADGLLGEVRVVLLVAPITTTIDVIASREEVAEAQMEMQEKQRLVGVIPNFYVSYDWTASPLTSRQKFKLAWKNASDPGNLLLVAAVAGVEQATGSFNGYGQGAQGYGKRYGAGLGNLVSGTFIGGAVLPSLFHQDPRYFYKGTGSLRSRFLYAISTAVITRGDNGKRQPAWASVLGDLSAGALSNLYYAPSDRQGASLTLTNGLLSVAGDAFNSVVQEFLLRRFTPKHKP